MLIDITTSSPPYQVNQKKAAEELKKRMAVTPSVARMIDMVGTYSGIDTRFTVIPDADENANSKFYSENGRYIKPGTSARMIEYEKWSKELGKNAVKLLLEKNNIEPSSIEKLITISCTGFFAPGLDYFLINEFNLSPAIKRINIGFMGCAASLIGFNSVHETLTSNKETTSNTLLVSVELCSLHLQTEPSKDNILANMIFADGCSAALFSNSSNLKKNNSLKIASTYSVLFENSERFMGWNVGNFGFEMVLSADLPKIISKTAAPALKNYLAQNNLTVNKIKYWAIHPGGKAILDACQNGLELSDEQMLPSRNILKNYGNMSSASILFVLKEILETKQLKPDDYCCAVAFGPGLTMEAVVLRVA